MPSSPVRLRLLLPGIRVRLFGAGVMPGTPEDARSFADGPALPPMQCGTIVSWQGLFLPHRCVMVFFHALQGILSLQIIVTVAYVLARKGWFSPETQILLPRLVTTVALPSYLFYTITHSFGRDDLVHLLYGSLFPLLSILLTFGVAWLIATIARVERRHFGLFCASFSTSNTVFIGLPVNLALFGDAAAPYVLLYFFANTSFFWSVGSYLISHDNEELRGSATLLDNVRHIFSPPMLGFLAGLAMTLLGLGLPDFVQEALRYMGNLTTPLALIFIGICLYKMDLRHLHLSRDLVLALLGKLVICPLILAGMLHFVDLPELMEKVFIIQAGLPCMMQISILGAVYKTDASFGALLVSLSTILSVITIPIAMTLLSL